MLAIALLWVPASIAATPADTAATLTYLEADYQLELAILHNAAASHSAAESLAGRLGSECHGVLAGAPNEELAPPSSNETTPRARGELQQSELQLQTIEAELRLTLSAAIYEPDRAAVEAFAAQVAPLSWSDPRIGAIARFRANELTEALTPPAVCADMKSWADSGYHVLSPASRAFEATQQARLTVRPEGSIGLLLKPDEGPHERKLIRQTQSVYLKVTHALASTLRVFSSLQRALGVAGNGSEEQELEPVLGRRHTRAGVTFTVRREKHIKLRDSSCRRSVSVEASSPQANGGSSGSETSRCLSGRHAFQPSGSCSGEVQSITAAVPASIDTVRLLLSDGRTITSSVVHVPPRDGGPAGVYVQAVRGYSPYPVSLSELDTQGKVVRVVNVGFHCHKEPAANGPTFVNLAEGTLPGGETFEIQGIVVHFGRGQTSFSLSVGLTLQKHHEAEGPTGNAKPKAFTWSLDMGCRPLEYAIVYGTLAAPGSSVLARTPAGLVPLTKVELAPDLHSGGPLVYGVFATLPSELVVLGSNGSTIYTESLAAKGNEEAEYCAGYEEK